MLNVPDLRGLTHCLSTLPAGAGGGYDIFCGLPIYFALRERGQTVHLASHGLSAVTYLKGSERLSDTLVAATLDCGSLLPYLLDLHLARLPATGVPMGLLLVAQLAQRRYWKFWTTTIVLLAILTSFVFAAALAP